jgi:hypothetical protein
VGCAKNPDPFACDREGTVAFGDSREGTRELILVRRLCPLNPLAARFVCGKKVFSFNPCALSFRPNKTCAAGQSVSRALDPESPPFFHRGTRVAGQEVSGLGEFGDFKKTRIFEFRNDRW